MTYDVDDHLITASSATGTRQYGYDGEGNRIRISSSGASLQALVAPILDGPLSAPHLMTNASGDVVAGYVYAGLTPLLRFGSSGEQYYLEDGLGSVIALADADAEVAERIEYDAFGRVTSGSVGTPATAGDFRFQGMWLDEGTGLYHARARSYDALTGRFLSRDAAVGETLVPETLLPYAFGQNAPTAYLDPTGWTTLSEVNVTTLINQGLSVAARASLEVIKNKARDAAIEWVSKEILNRFGGSLPFLNVFGAKNFFDLGNKFAEVVSGEVCKAIGTLGGKDILYLESAVAPDGRPLTNGLTCSERQMNKSLKGKLPSRALGKHSRPDLLFSPEPPQAVGRTGDRTYALAEIKLSKPRADRQFDTFVRHAANWSHSRALTYLTLRAVSDAQKLAFRQRAQAVARAATPPGVATLFFVSILK